jgi:hypothetical protein
MGLITPFELRPGKPVAGMKRRRFSYRGFSLGWLFLMVDGLNTHRNLLEFGNE